MPKSILIVDDSSVVRKTLKSLLEQGGEWAVCGEAVNGGEALEKAEQLHPDLVVIDFAMPVMNGFEVASVIKRTAPRVPLILFTAYKDRILEQQALSHGFSAVISKEDDSKKLVQSARNLLNSGVGTGSVSRQNLETELAALEHMDWEYYRNRDRSRADVCAYITRQRRRREVLQQLSSTREPKPEESKPEHSPRLAADSRDTQITIYSDREGIIPGRASHISGFGFSAVLPVEMAPGELVKVHIELAVGARSEHAVVRSRNAFRHEFEFLHTPSTTKMTRFSEFS